RLADLESREVLLAKLAGGFNAPAQKLVSVLAAPLQQLARLLGALEAKTPAEPSVVAGGEDAVAAASELPSDETPGVEETPDTTVADAAGDDGGAAQAVADATDVVPG